MVMAPNATIPGIVPFMNFFPNILWGGFFLLAFIFVIMTLILLYHWSAYGDRSLRVGFTGLAYLAGGVTLLFLLFLSVNAYIASL